jgi:hypothetical protein
LLRKRWRPRLALRIEIIDEEREFSAQGSRQIESKALCAWKCLSGELKELTCANRQHGNMQVNHNLLPVVESKATAITMNPPRKQLEAAATIILLLRFRLLVSGAHASRNGSGMSLIQNTQCAGTTTSSP